MKRIPKTQTSEPSLRDRLTSQFIEALEKDWAVHGTTVVAQVREQHPTKYAELIVRLVPVDPPITGGQGDFSQAKSQADIARKLLADIGCTTPSDDMIEMAVTAQLRFVARLEEIAAEQEIPAGELQ
jgi:hypothetical protein